MLYRLHSVTPAPKVISHCRGPPKWYPLTSPLGLGTIHMYVVAWGNFMSPLVSAGAYSSSQTNPVLIVLFMGSYEEFNQECQPVCMGYIFCDHKKISHRSPYKIIIFLCSIAQCCIMIVLFIRNSMKI